jgi:hypothetical protein
MKQLRVLATICISVGCTAITGAAGEPNPGASAPQHQSAVVQGEQQHAPTNWVAVRAGMTTNEVRQLLGEPKSVFPSPSQLVIPVAKGLLKPDRWWPEMLVIATALAINPATYGGAKGYHEGWEYPRDPGPVFHPSYYVYFDASRKVVRLSAPDDPDRQPLVQISEAPLDKLIPLWEETTGVTIEYDPVLVQNVTVNIEGIEDPHMLEPRVQEACEQSGLQLSKVCTDRKTVYTIKKKEPANKMPGHVP